ncbi:MAG: hypothetical protein IJ131_09545 [Eggerthellaceae bacterium]|nr:hypothetical protein [Eggerthellaceae bacterium]
MHFSVEELNEFRRRIAVVMDPSEVDAELAHTYADFAYRFPFEGHEPGTAPRSAVDEAFGAEAVAASAGDELREAGFGQALDQADLVKIGEASFSQDADPEPGHPYRFVAEVDCSPHYELTSYDPVVVRLPAMGTNAAMAPALQKMRENEALHVLQQRLIGEIPEVMADTKEQLQLQEIYAKASAQNMPFENYLIQQRIDPNVFRKELEEQAVEMVRRDLALDAWARHIGVEVTDKMVAANFARSGVAHPALEEARWRANGRIAELRQAIRRAGAMRDIMQTLVIETI